jgi:tetratricopeptide (TPR) repeat protein
MSQTPTQPVAQGTLANTPFAHLVLYIYQRRSSGTLVVRDAVGEATGPAKGLLDQPVAVLFHRGRAVAARVTPGADALDQALLPLCSVSDAVYEFFEDDLVGSGAAIVTGMFDPYAFVTEAARRHTRQDVVEHVLTRFAATPLCVQPGMDLDRMLLSSQESSFAEVLRDGSATIGTLLAARKLPEAAARRLLYALLVTKVVGANVPANDQAAGPQTTGAPDGLPAGQSSDAPSSSRNSSLSPEQRRRQSSAAWSAIAARAQQVSRPISGPLQQSQPAGRSMTPPKVASQPTRPLSQPQAAPPGRSLSPTPSASNSGIRSVTPPGSFGVRRSPAPPEMPSPPPGRVVTGAPLEHSSSQSGTPRITTPSRPISRVSPRPNSEPLESLDAAGKYRRVEAMCTRGAFDEALPIIRALVESERRNPSYLGLLASVLYGQGIEGTISKEIVDIVNQALRIHPDEVHSLYTKARCYKRMGKIREALHYFKRTVTVDPAHLDAAREVRLLTLRQNEKGTKR